MLFTPLFTSAMKMPAKTGLMRMEIFFLKALLWAPSYVVLGAILTSSAFELKHKALAGEVKCMNN